MAELSANFEPLTPLSFMERSRRAFGDREAVVYGPHRYSYAEFAERIQRCASALRAAGIRPGDRVAYLSPNLLALLEAHFAVPLLGALLVSINFRLAPDEIAFILAHSGAKILVSDSKCGEPLSEHIEWLSAVEMFVNIVDEVAGHAC